MPEYPTLLKCNICEDEGVEVKMPYDHIGLSLMQQHFREQHPEHYDKMADWKFP